MIQILLKHAIYELCIDRLFEEIQKNFPIFSPNLLNFSKGDCVQVQVFFKDSQKIFRTCRIVYKKGKDVVIESMDFKRPVNLVLRDGTLMDMIPGPVDDYEKVFEVLS